MRRYSRQTIHQNYNKYRPMIKEVFESLRKKGIIARVNFSCCGSCGSYELNEKLSEEKNKNKIGYVFWHKQSEESFKHSGSVYLYYNGKGDDNKSIEVANIIVDELKNQNIPYEWNGSINDAIFVGEKHNG